MSARWNLPGLHHSGDDERSGGDYEDERFCWTCTVAVGRPGEAYAGFAAGLTVPISQSIAARRAQMASKLQAFLFRAVHICLLRFLKSLGGSLHPLTITSCSRSCRGITRFQRWWVPINVSYLVLV